MLLSAAAQNGAPPASKPIIFSAPAGDVVSSNAPSLLPRPVNQPGFDSDLRAPVSVFSLQSPPPLAPLPARAPAVSRAEARRLQKAMDERENWALLTPAELLGLDTAEDTRRTADQTAGGGQRNLTVVQRYLERQRRARAGVTNDYTDNPSSGWAFASRAGGATNGSSLNPVRIGWPASAQMLNRFFDDAPADNPFTRLDENRSAAWLQPLDSPSQPAAPTPEQLAERERFKQLLEPGWNADTPAKPPPGGKSPASLQPLFGTITEQTPRANSVGASFTPLSGGLGRPQGLIPLPGITAPINWQSPASVSSGGPQPPPWLQQTPQPFTMPQRKF
jgi:hypothetical protein